MWYMCLLFNSLFLFKVNYVVLFGDMLEKSSYKRKQAVRHNVPILRCEFITDCTEQGQLLPTGTYAVKEPVYGKNFKKGRISKHFFFTYEYICIFFFNLCLVYGIIYSYTCKYLQPSNRRQILHILVQKGTSGVWIWMLSSLGHWMILKHPHTMMISMKWLNMLYSRYINICVSCIKKQNKQTFFFIEE